jgi:dolichol kinase
MLVTPVVENTKDDDLVWRKNNPPGSSMHSAGGDAEGMFMSITLVPVLLQSMGQSAYAVITAIALVLCWCWDNSAYYTRKTALGSRSMALLLLLLFAAVAVVTSRILIHHNVLSANDSRLLQDIVSSTKTLVFIVSWMLFYTAVQLRYSTTVLHKVVTKGEWLVVSSGMSIALTEFVFTSAVSNDSLYAYTAVAGLIGCGTACAAADLLVSKESVVLRMIFVVVVALGTVEGCFWMQAVPYPFPKCLWWIFGDFLMSVEQQQQPASSLAGRILPASLTELPRMAWLAYWVVTMGATIPLAPGNNASAVIARKWFHLVAVLLFVPVTVAAPQLQSLSYAIALAVLLLLESTRHRLPWLNDFYLTYLDTSKDESQDSTIISHMALIAGCAAPLWLVQWWESTIAVDNDTNAVSTMRSVLLPLWGVWTLGVGDAMGAVVGKNCGRVHWGQQRRTVEGSVAMFICLYAVCFITLWYETDGRDQMMAAWTQLLHAVAFVTLLEAFTLQIDNIVLPLAGAAIIFVCTMQ